MSDDTTGATGTPPTGRAGRNLPAAVASGVVLLILVGVSLFFVKFLFVLVAIAAVLLGVWELRNALAAGGINLPHEPLMLGSVAMLLAAWFGGAPALSTALAVTALVTLMWRMRQGIDGFVRDATAGVFVATYLPFLAGFVALLLEPDDGAARVITFILVTVSSDIGGYFAGVLFGRHKMTPVISPKKSWEGFAGSAAACMGVGVLLVVWLLDGDWWVGILLGIVAVVMGTLGDLCVSVIKRDLGIKDMSQMIPGHGGLMDRLDSLLAAVAPIWLLLYYLVP